MKTLHLPRPAIALVSATTVATYLFLAFSPTPVSPAATEKRGVEIAEVHCCGGDPLPECPPICPKTGN